MSLNGLVRFVPGLGTRSFLSALLLVLFSPVGAQSEPGVVSPDQLVPFGDIAYMVPDFEMPPKGRALSLLKASDDTPEAVLLRNLMRRGQGSGFDNVIYDNRDRAHSIPRPGTFPSLVQLGYAPKLKQMNLDYGLGGKIILPVAVIGNSSTAITNGSRPRSQPRLAMTRAREPLRAFLTYVNNHLFIYPEHLDHDEIDRFPANWPYMIITQGSSFSDKPFLRAILMATAALSPQTRQKLNETKLLAPTLQMILRRSLRSIYTRETYLSRYAHPVVFSKEQLAPERMVSLAGSLQPGHIPPMVVLTVEQEDFQQAAGLAQLSETLFDTPSAIARIWRSDDFTKRMVVSAADTTDPNGNPLQFSWVLLGGDPDRVRITPIGENGARAEISIDWHDTWQVAPINKRTTSRLDIGVFAWNGYHDSAPAMISIKFPGHQIRRYEERPDGAGMRLKSIDYDASQRKARYDPAIFWFARWKDDLIYDDASNLIRIDRTFRKNAATLSSLHQLSDGTKVRYDLTNRGRHRSLSMTKLDE